MLARSRQYGMVFYDDALCITGWNEGAQFITGSRFWSSGVSMALAGEDGGPAGFVKIFRDVTHLGAVNSPCAFRSAGRTGRHPNRCRWPIRKPVEQAVFQASAQAASSASFLGCAATCRIRVRFSGQAGWAARCLANQNTSSSSSSSCEVVIRSWSSGMSS